MRYLLFFLMSWCSVACFSKMDPKDYEFLKAKTDVYLNKVQAQSDWLLSRRRMFTCPRKIYFPTQEINIVDYQIVRC